MLFQCLIFNREVLTLLETIKILVYNTTSKKYTTNLTSATKDTFNTIFGQETPFEFVCKNCLPLGRTYDVINGLKETIKKTKVN